MYLINFKKGYGRMFETFQKEKKTGRILKTVRFIKISAVKLKNRFSQNGKTLARFNFVLI